MRQDAVYVEEGAVIQRRRLALAGLPFLIRPKIGPAGFAFDNPDFAFRPQGHDIHPQARRRHQFLDTDEIELPQRTRHPALKALSGKQAGKVVRLVHGANMN